MKTFLLVSLLYTASFAIEPIVSPQWLSKNLNNKNLVVVEVSSEDNYKSGHIQNAINTNIGNWRFYNGTFWSIKAKNEIQDEIQRLGIDKNSEIVLYADIKAPIDFLKASYIFWALNYHGINNVALLDGGKNRWVKDISILDKKDISITKSSYISELNHNLIADKMYVKNVLGKIPMLDARPFDKYLGITPTAPVKRDGHIKGAMSYSWNYSIDKSYNLKDIKKLDDFFKNGYKFEKGSEILVYCTGGLETSFNYFILSGVLNYKQVRLYDASMMEWGNSEDTPMTQYSYEIFKK